MNPLFRNRLPAMAALLCGLLLPTAPRAAATGFTLQESIAAHDTLRMVGRDLTVDPQGKYVAWREEGHAYVAAAPDFTARRLPAIKGNRASGAPTALYASRDGHTLVMAYGAVEPAFGPYPEADHRQWWSLDMRQGKPQLLAQGAQVPRGEPVFAPDGSFAVAEGNMLYHYRIVAGALQRQPLLERDAQHYGAVALGQLAWSPDGSRLAFVSRRKAGQSYVGVVDIASRAYRYLQPGIFRDVSPVWSPDGAQLAFVRMAGNWTREYRFSPARESAPWRLMAAAADSGEVRTVWQADPGTGSVFKQYGAGTWYDATLEQQPQLLWTRTGNLLFPWEKSGWLAVYAVPATGGMARALTQDDAEATLPVLSADERSLVYASNAGDAARMHMWRVSLDGATPPQALTTGKGVEHSPAFVASGVLSYIANIDGRMPNRRMLSLADGRRIALTPLPQEEATQRALWEQFVDTEVVSLRAADGVLTQHLLMVPRGAPPPGGFPVIVSAKGGPDGRVSPGNGVTTALGQYAVSQGYIFMEINYRGCFGFGLDYRLPPGRGATGGSEVEDLAAVARYLHARPDVDRARIGIMGGSYGGHLVGLALTRLPQYFAAGAHLSGVSDWVLEMKKDGEDGWASAPPPYIRLSERTAIEDLAYESSPPAQIASWRAPTFISMGEQDTSGHMEGIIDLGERLLEQGVHVEFHIAPEARHTGPRARPPDKVFDFFQRMFGRAPDVRR